MKDIAIFAETIARDAHAGQMRRDGVTPYILHPEAVAAKLKGESDEVIATAWLHDVLEDTPVTECSLDEAGVPERVIAAVVVLTKWSRRQPYTTYLSGVKADEIARKVKIADMLHNLSDSPTDRQIVKYAKGLLFLMNPNP